MTWSVRKSSENSADDTACTLFDKDRKDARILRYDSAECGRVVEDF